METHNAFKKKQTVLVEAKTISDASIKALELAGFKVLIIIK
jgi:hypothetical protein